MTTILGECLARHAARAAATPAWIAADGDVGFAEVEAEVAGFAGWLVDSGVAGANVVGVSIADDRRNAVACLALLALGIPQVTLPTTDPRPMRSALARRLRVGRVLADVGDQDVDGAAATLVPERAPRRSGRGAIEALGSDPDAPAVYITSSGTTGRPKILAYTQRAIAQRARSAARVEEHAAGDRVYVPAGAQGFLARTTRLYSMFEGVTSVVHDGGTTAAAILDRCRRTRATVVHLSVLQVTSAVAADGSQGRLDDAVKVFSNSSRLPAGVASAFERRVGGRLYDRYGATEVGVLATTYPRGDEGVPDGVGRIVPGARVEIVDANGDPLPAGAIGEIRARTPQMAGGYVDDPELSRRHFRDGWFYPGDLGAFTGDGVLRFLGRRDDMMSLGGFNVFPAEIERVLDAHPSVRASAAFPLRSPVFGEIPAAAVELDPRDAVRVEDLLAYARERLGVRAPRRIVVVGSMPRNTAGKVMKGELAARLADDAEA